MTDDLVGWLGKQLDDDELIARAVEGSGSWDVPSTGVVQLGGVEGVEGLVPTSRTVAYHMAEHDPARVLAEIGAKRRILDLVTDSGPGWRDGYTEAYRDVVRLLALPYADRAGYQEAWKP